jgi:hypothetical protein
VARAAGVREATVALGVDELDAGAAPLGRTRRPGGGRKRAVDLDPGLRPALLALVEPDERGDPMSPLRWTTTGTGLSVHAQLDTGEYPTGIQINDAQMAALPIARHTVHGDWNHTLHPQTTEAENAAATRDDAHTPPPDTLMRPAFTGMTTEELTALTTALTTLRDTHQGAIHTAHREALETVDHNGTRPHAPRSGRPPTFPLGDRVLATVLHLRLGLPDNTLAHLLTTSRATIRRAINETRRLLDEHGTHITAAPTPPRSLVNLLAATAAQRKAHP